MKPAAPPQKTNRGQRPAGPPEVYYKEARRNIQMLRGNMPERPLVLEIGCNDGMHTQIFLEEIPAIRLHCFEPDPRPIQRLLKVIEAAPTRAFLYCMAIAAKSGPVPWFASGGTTQNSWLDDWDLSGSIRKPTGHLQLSPWVTFQETGTVPGIALDDWASQLLAPSWKIDLIWADVQGAEGDMIAGGEKTFRERVRYLWTEYYATPMYEGQPNLDQILAMLPGWEVVMQTAQDVYLKNTKVP